MEIYLNISQLYFSAHCSFYFMFECFDFLLLLSTTKTSFYYALLILVEERKVRHSRPDPHAFANCGIEFPMLKILLKSSVVVN